MLVHAVSEEIFDLRTVMHHAVVHEHRGFASYLLQHLCHKLREGVAGVAALKHLEMHVPHLLTDGSYDGNRFPTATGHVNHCVVAYL